MKCIIHDTEDKFDKDFIEFLKPMIKFKLYDKLKDIRKLEAAEFFINNYTKYPSVFKPYISAYEVVTCGIENLLITKINQKLTIEIDPIQILPGTSAKLCEVCKLINNGSLGSLNSYPIFTSVFEDVKKRIDEYYDFYIERGV